jgi:hypothetical protein
MSNTHQEKYTTPWGFLPESEELVEEELVDREFEDRIITRYIEMSQED